MSDLSFTEKILLEKVLRMGSGYVLEFSNRTFQEFVAESVNRNIYDRKYDQGSGSKANRLRAFWKIEPNHLVGKLLTGLLTYSRAGQGGIPNEQYEQCTRIAERLRQGAPVFDIAPVDPEVGERAMEVLERSVKQAIDNNEPESGLDRLHTYVVKYMRAVCKKRGIPTPREKPLHALLGEYVKCLKREALIESEMTERILKSSISTMEAFNRVRNEQSLAHDNPVLNYNESLLIFNHIMSSLRFIQSLERASVRPDGSDTPAQGDDHIPF